jgi:hypothetical protein
MGIQYIPGPEALLAPAAATIAQGVAKFLNPNRQLQFKVREEMATNPDLIQKLGDLESGNPGLMHQLGLGPIADVISSVTPSTKELIDRATQPDAPATAVARQKAEKTGADAQTAKNMMTGDIIKKAGDIMAADPSISFDAALQTLTGQTASQRTVSKAEEKVRVETANKQLEGLQRAGQIPKDLKTIDWKAEATDFLNGNFKEKGAVFAAYFGNPDTGKTFQEAIDGVKQERQIAASKALAALHGDKSVDNFRTQKAFQEYEKSGGVGTLDSWQSFLFDPEAQQRARELAGGAATPANQSDRDLLNIAKVTKQQVDTDKLKDIATLNNKIAAQMKTMDTSVSDQARQVAIDGLNMLLKQRGAMGGMDVTASYNDRGFWLPGRVEYKDTKTGKMIDAEVVNAVIADPLGADITAKGPALNDRARNALALIQNYGGDKVAAFNKFKMQDQSPGKADSRAVEAELVRAGLIKRVGGNTGAAGKS